eukprot:TRINITY_DN8154_c0_g1_i1.p1 TRINITY_DN8154_c0_g1~~TRINITY_DN8154_c0_g1_i1.p1  ORF type:complete len:461 (+),score=96.71 TRINITY_DN8154_c0_g1_i1:90-1385(+)
MSKFMVPIVNRPLLSFQIELLDAAKFAEVIVVIPKSKKKEFHAALEMMTPGRIKMKLTIEVVPESIGTADVLRHLKSRLVTDFVVISGDLVTDVSLHSMAVVHRANDATVTMLLREPPPPSATAPAATTKGSGGKASELDSALVDFIALDVKKERVLLYQPQSEVNGDYLSVSKKLLRRYPSLNIRRDISDQHLYFFSPWVMEVLEIKKFTSIKYELVPYLVQKQFARPRPDTIKGKILQGPADMQQLAHSFSVSLNSDAIPGGDTQLVPKPSIRCCAFVSDSGLCVRANTIETYWELNRELAKTPSQFSVRPWDQEREAYFADPGVDIGLKATIGSESVVAAGVKIGERSVLKRAVIGRHTQIGKDVRITNAIIFDHVVISDGCNITNTIVCSNAHLQERVTLKDSTVGMKYQVPAGVNWTGANLMTSSE